MAVVLEIIAGLIISYVVITTIIDTRLMGRLDIRLSFQNNANGYIIKRKNRIDMQTGYQCSAFSVAYLLRHHGISASGEEIYPNMPDKMKDGCVYPKGLCHTLSGYGFNVRYCSGNLEALQKEIYRGNPVIVMIKVRKDKNWLHYVPVVGFNDRYIFIAESLSELVNCGCEFYNRRVEKKEFLQLWNTAMLRQPLYKNTYFIVEKRRAKKMFWDKIAGLYDLFENIYNKEVYIATGKEVANLLKENDDVLECACGTGAISQYISDKVHNLTATDFSEGMLKQARRKLHTKNNITFAQVDITNLPYKDQSFDAVVAGNVIHLIKNPENAMQELMRVCKKGGRIIIPTYINNSGNTSRIAVRFLEKLGADFKRQFDAKSYAEFFDEMNFTNVKFVIVNGRMPCDIAIIDV